jgi:hypothetical protein
MRQLWSQGPHPSVNGMVVKWRDKKSVTECSALFRKRPALMHTQMSFKDADGSVSSEGTASGGST